MKKHTEVDLYEALGNTLADLVEVCADLVDRSRELFLLRVVHLNDVPVNRHFPKISTHVVGFHDRHLVFNEFSFILTYRKSYDYWPCPVCHACLSFRRNLKGFGESQQADFFDLGDVS